MPDRRQLFALATLALCHPRLLLAQSAAIDDAHRDVVRALIDRLLPAHGPHPGARALGVDIETLRTFEAKRTGRMWIRLVVRELGGRAFLDLPPDEQDARIAGLIADGAPTSALYRTVLHHATSAYFSRPESQAAFGYRAPQPDGWPDYAAPTTAHDTRR